MAMVICRREEERVRIEHLGVSRALGPELEVEVEMGGMYKVGDGYHCHCLCHYLSLSRRQHTVPKYQL